MKSKARNCFIVILWGNILCNKIMILKLLSHTKNLINRGYSFLALLAVRRKQFWCCNDNSNKFYPICFKCGNRKVPRKYRSSSNMSKIGQPEWGYLPLNFFNFSHFRGVATITRTNIIRSVSNFGNRKVPTNYRSRLNISKISNLELGDIFQKGFLSQ